ncbi:MAG: IS4 family transposase [Pseudobdellovibrionaceae bacterium]
MQFFAQSEKSFTRNRKLNLTDLIGLICSFAANRNRSGYDISSQQYFARQDLTEATARRSSITEARSKLSFEAFIYLLERLNEKAPEERWNGLRVFAVDGSRITLPHAKEVLKKFVANNNTHYPKGLLVCATNVLTGVVRSASISEEYGSERAALIKLSESFRDNDLLLLDRGFEGFETWKSLNERGIKFICRARSAGALSHEVREFVESGKKESVVELNQNDKALQVRLIRGRNDYKGRPLVLVTNLLDTKKFKTKEIRKTYLKRWKIETSYYRVKELMSLENFHAKTLNGVLQEIWANLFVLSMTLMLAWRASQNLPDQNDRRRINFKNALECVSVNIHFFVRAKIKGIRRWAKVIMESIKAITFVHQPGRKNARISKQPMSTWIGSRKNRCTERYKKKRGIW